MFAAKIAGARAKAPENPTRTLAPGNATFVARPFGGGAVEQGRMFPGTIGNQAMLRRYLMRRSSNWPVNSERHEQEGAQETMAPREAPGVPRQAGMIQPKLVVGEVNDPLEHEADRVADQVMRMPDPAILIGATPVKVSRKCADCEEEAANTLQREPAGPGRADGGEAPGIVHEALRTPGRPLDPSTRAFFEPRFGRSFSDVRVHDDAKAASSARAVAALAYTVGSHLVFSEGQYRPDTAAGRYLLSHELTHTVQQGAAPLMRSPSECLAAGGVRRSMSGAPLLLQRAVPCSLDHLDRECGSAAATCAAIQSSYCQGKYPKPTDIDTLHNDAVSGATSYKSTYPTAAANLLHYLDGTGSEQVMPVPIFKNDSATTNKLENEHRDKFIEGGKRRFASGVLKPGGGQVEMAWTGTASAFSILNRTDLGLAVGGYTLCSRVKVSAAANAAGGTTMSFDEWQVQAFDCYNWDPGKGIGIPGADDSDLCCLENAKRAMHYRVRSDPWPNDDAAAIAPADIAGPSSPPAGKSGGTSSGGNKR